MILSRERNYSYPKSPSSRTVWGVQGLNPEKLCFKDVPFMPELTGSVNGRKHKKANYDSNKWRNYPLECLPFQGA